MGLVFFELFGLLKTASLFIVFFIKLNVLGQRAGWYFRKAASIEGGTLAGLLSVPNVPKSIKMRPSALPPIPLTSRQRPGSFPTISRQRPCSVLATFPSPALFVHPTNAVVVFALVRFAEP